METIGSRRIVASLEGLDNVSMESSDALENETSHNGYVDVLYLSSSYLAKNEKTGELDDHFDEKEVIEDFWAGLAGAYRGNSQLPVYRKIDGTIVVVISYEQPLDIIMIERLRKQYNTQKLIIIYESSEGELTAPKGVILKRAPFELI